MTRVWFAAASLAVLPIQQQQPPRYAETIDVASVLVDVRVLDDKGSPILGLDASDFLVSLGGKAVRVQSCAWIGDAVSPAVREPVPTATASSAPVAAPGRLVVFLVQKNLARGYGTGLIRMLDQSRAVVRSLAADDRVAVLSFDTSLKIWTDFTSDIALVDHLLERGVLHEEPPPVRGPQAPSLAGRLDSQTARRAYTIERAFELIARALQPLPGAKTIAFISHGMGRLGRRSSTDGDASVAPGYENARAALSDARASVFSLDFTPADVHSLAFGLQRIAAETGGFYAQSLDFPERPMRWLSGALSGYYVLFVDKPDVPPAKRDISVVLTRRQGTAFASASYTTSQR